MPGKIHEFRDPVHVFIRLESAERDVVDSLPFQRLRDIHQLALTYLIYPGATHKRFEHSLGVMEVATRIYDTVTAPQNIRDESVRKLIPNDGFDHGYWRRVLRMAALLHDVGHLPFSHAAEKLLPEGSSHETISQTLIEGDLADLLHKALHVRPSDVARLALGNKYRGGPEFDPWERILSEIIVGNAFGADRIDYLLRDSLHAGVSYGRFDHHRLIDTLRILPGESPSLGIEEGGLHAAEALVWARYFMYAQVYFHSVRRIYDIHLKEFL